MKRNQNRLMLLLATTMMLGLAACDEKGPAERAGQDLDRAGQRLRDAVDPPAGPVERLGRAVDRATN
jgi:predicted small lipoprotein YifL